MCDIVQRQWNILLKLHISILFVRFRVFCFTVFKISDKTPEIMLFDQFGLYDSSE